MSLINLRNQHVDVFAGDPDAEPEVLRGKYRYVSSEHPKFAA